MISQEFPNQPEFVALGQRELRRVAKFRRLFRNLTFALALIASLGLLVWIYRAELTAIVFEYLPAEWQTELLFAQASPSAEVLEHLDSVYLGLEGDRMTNPIYSGFDGKEVPFVITAESALKVQTEDGFFLLEAPEATFKQGTQSEATVTSRTGRYAPEKNLLLLHDDVVIRDIHGVRTSGSQATLFLETGHAVIGPGVQSSGPRHRFSGSQLDIFWEEDLWHLDGPASVSLVSQKD